jgi:hypothetical protein
MHARQAFLSMVMAPKSKSHLRLLGELILESIHTIECRLDAECVEFPALAQPFNPNSRAEAVLLEDGMLAATSQIVAAASQLIAMVRSPVQTIMENSMLVNPRQYAPLIFYGLIASFE